MRVPLTTGPTSGIRPSNVGVTEQAFVRVVRRSRNCVSGTSKVGLLVIEFLTVSLVQVSNSVEAEIAVVYVQLVSHKQRRKVRGRVTRSV